MIDCVYNLSEGSNEPAYHREYLFS